MARWQVDDKPPVPTLAHCGQFARDHFDVPVCQEFRLRVELAEAALREITEIRPQDRIVFVGRKVFYHPSTPRSRALIRLMICWSPSVILSASAEPGSARLSRSRKMLNSSWVAFKSPLAD